MSTRRPRIAGERRPDRTSTPDDAPAADAPVGEASVRAAPAAAVNEAEAPPAPAKPPRPPMTRVQRIVLATLGVLAVVAVVFAVIVTLSVRQTESDAEARVEAADKATAAASDALEAMLGYRHASVQKDLDAATALMTDDFAKEYEQLAPQVATAAKQRKIDVTATVRGIAPLECGQECSTSDVRLLAFVDQTRTIAGKPGSPAALSVVIRMHEVDGDWRVAEMTSA